jgi:protein-tyrosine-phosphatase
MKSKLMVLSLLSALAVPALVQAEQPEKATTIVFVCLHGSVKSQMAAAHFNRIAKQRGLPFTAISRGLAVDDSIPPRIREGLSLDGLAPLDDVPRALTAEEANGAAKIFAFDDVPAERKGAADVTYWSDVPPATKNYNAARDAIVRHLDELVPSLANKN